MSTASLTSPHPTGSRWVSKNEDSEKDRPEWSTEFLGAVNTVWGKGFHYHSTMLPHHGQHLLLSTTNEEVSAVHSTEPLNIVDPQRSAKCLYVGAIGYHNPPVLDDILAVVRGFNRLEDGWDGSRSSAPKPGVIEDALVVLQNWQFWNSLPEPEVTVDGNIVLEMYDDDGFLLGGIELVGEHKAVYSILQLTDVLGKGSFDTTSQTEIIFALSNFASFAE